MNRQVSHFYFLILPISILMVDMLMYWTQLQHFLHRLILSSPSPLFPQGEPGLPGPEGPRGQKGDSAQKGEKVSWYPQVTWWCSAGNWHSMPFGGVCVYRGFNDVLYASGYRCFMLFICLSVPHCLSFSNFPPLSFFQGSPGAGSPGQAGSKGEQGDRVSSDRAVIMYQSLSKLQTKSLW